MKRLSLLAALAASTLTGLAAPAVAQSPAEQRAWDAAQRRYDAETRLYRDAQDRYEAARRRNYGGGRYGSGYGNAPAYDGGYYDDRFATDYDASRDYRDGPGYSERRLSSNDQVYRGSDGRYYCKRSDGTTGLIIGAAGGGILGNVIDGGRHRTGGTLIGGALGALLGRSIDQNQDVRCR